MYLNLMYIRSKTTFTMSMYTQIKFNEMMSNSPEIIHFKIQA